MAKGWTTISNTLNIESKETKSSRAKKARIFDTMMRTTKDRSILEIKKESNENFKNKVAKEKALIDAYNNKQLKSKELIEKAQELIAITKTKKQKGSKNGSNK